MFKSQRLDKTLHAMGQMEPQETHRKDIRPAVADILKGIIDHAVNFVPDAVDKPARTMLVDKSEIQKMPNHKTKDIRARNRDQARGQCPLPYGTVNGITPQPTGPDVFDQKRDREEYMDKEGQ